MKSKSENKSLNLSMLLGRRALAIPLMGLALAGIPSAHAGTDPFIGQVMCGGWNFAPNGWMEMDGRLLPIAEYDALFALIGTTFGGDGQTTFALPDTRSRMVVSQGQGPGLSNRVLGQAMGSESQTLTSSQLPAHSHGYRPQGSLGDATALSPAGAVAANKARTTLYAPGPGTVAMQGVQSSVAGGSQPFQVQQPYQAIKCVIAVWGIFPSQN
nr:tail fiber protein [uncultured Roseateles sp.]